MQKTGLIWLLFGYKGRISRSQFWIGVGINFCILLVGFVLTYAVNGLFLVIFFAGFLISGFMVAIKRLHDRDKGDWWAVLFFIVPVLLNGRINGWSPIGDFGEAAATVTQLAAAAISIWGLVELGLLPGTIGENAYGPDPRGSRPELA
jgi:uncharacterized membrane protein YhaH (DUF805 family)